MIREDELPDSETACGERITQRIAELGDWRGDMLARMRPAHPRR